ncbi:hypothetical protein QTN47_18265 [Danxiaibacter flavus]|uniref:Uncharacterized protein n=1 Tax=Danxiaibacter flavus TaxID=3049108 RepID=A0ABV3ZI14_9BACT|nr:hypothetical protein QNM32_18275 [Chitinophagaceae bacterium DXS]
MIEHLPLYIALVFGLTTMLTLLLVYWTMRNSALHATKHKAVTVTILITFWLIIQAVISLRNIYSESTDAMPPRLFLFGVLPALITIALLFITSGGRRFVDSLPLKNITYLNIVRIPVEVVLFWLFVNKAVPKLMTFEGRNFDILSGITAPFVAYFGFTKQTLGRRVVLIWNFICLALLMNVVVHALLSVPTPIQRLAFDQPNIAVLHFPFVWLPVFIVPVVLFGHLVSIRQLARNNS